MDTLWVERFKLRLVTWSLWEKVITKNHEQVLVKTYLTNSMGQSPCWKANRFCVSQENFCILWNPSVHSRIHKPPPPVPFRPKYLPQPGVLNHSQPVFYHLCERQNFTWKYIYLCVWLRLVRALTFVSAQFIWSSGLTVGRCLLITFVTYVYERV